MIALAAVWRIAFLALSAPAIGAALMTMIAALTGARWRSAEAPAAWLPAVALSALLLGVAQAATPVPPHLATWLNPVLVALFGAVVVAGLWWAALLVRRGRSATVAGVTLAAYALVVTPLASDWMLGGVPGHPASAVGMTLVCQQIAAACALALVIGRGDEREQRDLAKLMVAAALGLGYLIFVDYLIIWFGNLPSRVDFYLARSAGWAPLPVILVLLLGWAAPVMLLSAGKPRERRIAGAVVLAALFLVDLWWVGGGVLVAAEAIVLTVLGYGAMVIASRAGARTAHV